MRKKNLKKRVNKEDSKAMSDVIAAFLIILLSLFLIVIIWNIVKGLAVDDAELTEVKTEFFGENIQITALTLDEEIVKISLQRIARKDRRVVNIWSQEEFEADLGIDIISVVDLSGSMVSCNGVSSSCCSNTLRSNSYSSGNCYGVSEESEGDCLNICRGSWVNRLDPTKNSNRELLTLLSELENSRIGIVSYSDGVIVSAGTDLTSDIDTLTNVIDSLEARGSTCICCGINEALRILEEQSSDTILKKIIVMSDGEANVRCPEQHTGNAMRDAILSSCNARSSVSNLTVYSVGAGENVNENTLREIAECGEGTYFSALNVSELIEAYRNIIREITTSYVSSYSRFDYIYVVFYNETNSYVEKISNIPENLVIRTYSFDLSDKLEGEIIKIEIYPVILLKSNREEIGPLFDSWILSG